jgi:hypothetical protein
MARAKKLLFLAVIKPNRSRQELHSFSQDMHSRAATPFARRALSTSMSTGKQLLSLGFQTPALCDTSTT